MITGYETVRPGISAAVAVLVSAAAWGVAPAVHATAVPELHGAVGTDRDERPPPVEPEPLPPVAPRTDLAPDPAWDDLVDEGPGDSVFAPAPAGGAPATLEEDWGAYHGRRVLQLAGGVAASAGVVLVSSFVIVHDASAFLFLIAPFTVILPAAAVRSAGTWWLEVEVGWGMPLFGAVLGLGIGLLAGIAGSVAVFGCAFSCTRAARRATEMAFGLGWATALVAPAVGALWGYERALSWSRSGVQTPVRRVRIEPLPGPPVPVATGSGRGAMQPLVRVAF